MPFGPTNASATFQALINDVLQPFLRHFALVFFDDILMYSSSWSEHLQHVKAILEVLRQHDLHLKRSKCAFGTSSMAYLGHVISMHGMAKDSDVLAHSVVSAWSAWVPWPHGYYHKFIWDNGVCRAPHQASEEGRFPLDRRCQSCLQ